MEQGKNSVFINNILIQIGFQGYFSEDDDFVSQ